MSDLRADHLWAYVSRPENRGMSVLKACCALPQSAHDGVTWAEFIGVRAWHSDDIPLLDAATYLTAANERADAAEVVNQELRAGIVKILDRWELSAQEYLDKYGERALDDEIADIVKPLLDATPANERGAAILAAVGTVLSCTTNRSGKRNMVADGKGREFSDAVDVLRALVAPQQGGEG